MAHPDDSQQVFRATVVAELDAMYRTARRMLQDHHQAQDAVQEALDKGWRSLSRFESGTNMKPWLFKILCNTCLDHLRGRTRQTARQVASDDDFVQQLPDPDRQPDEVFESRQLQRSIDAAIDGLPLGQQSVVQLVIVESFSYEQAANILELPIGTVRSRLSRARASLMTTLASVHDKSISESESTQAAAHSDNAVRLRVVR